MKEIILTEKPKVKINGVVCELEIDDIRIYAKIEQLSIQQETLYQGIENGSVSVADYLPVAKELLLLIMGEDMYHQVFPTEKAENDWVWHYQVCMGILPEIFASRMETIESFTKDGVIESLKQEEEKTEEKSWKTFLQKLWRKGKE